MTRSAAVLLAIIAACGSSDPLPGYRPATGDERATVMGVVEEYYALLDRAQVTGDASALLARHPGLATGQQRERGINIETWMVERTRALAVREVRVDIESYEPVRVYVKDTAAAAFVHGLFTWEYQQGLPTRGELAVRMDLARSGDRWTIERTDEWTLGETPPPTPRR
ncbi:MAG TPA: hypothetical protein VGS01_16345 [Candidatus Limnocylindria bacterium]|nr:hypothetical protein [Candidatus Limnocylindria bacterium]